MAFSRLSQILGLLLCLACQFSQGALLCPKAQAAALDAQVPFSSRILELQNEIAQNDLANQARLERLEAPEIGAPVFDAQAMDAFETLARAYRKSGSAVYKDQILTDVRQSFEKSDEAVHFLAEPSMGEFLKFLLDPGSRLDQFLNTKHVLYTILFESGRLHSTRAREILIELQSSIQQQSRRKKTLSALETVSFYTSEVGNISQLRSELERQQEILRRRAKISSATVDQIVALSKLYSSDDLAGLHIAESGHQKAVDQFKVLMAQDPYLQMLSPAMKDKLIAQLGRLGSKASALPLLVAENIQNDSVLYNISQRYDRLLAAWKILDPASSPRVPLLAP